MAMAARRWFWLAVALQILILFGLIGSHTYTVRTGVPVRLRAESFWRGETVQGQTVHLTYGISRIDPAKVPVQGGPFKPRQEIWVTLAVGDGGVATGPVAVSARRPQVQAGQVAIRGIVEWVNTNEPVSEPPPEKVPPGEPLPPEYKPMPPGAINIRYSFQQFALPDGETLTTPRPMSDFTVELAVDRFGRAALTRVFIDGREVKWR